MNKGTMIQEKEGRKRTGLVTDYDWPDPANRWAEILWNDGQLECFDSLVPDWNKWDEIEVISESR